MTASVFLSGFGIDGRIWNDRLPAQKRALILDWPDIKPTSVQAVAEALIDQIPDRATLIGWSLGGLVAMHIGALFPSKISRLILIAATPKFTHASNWRGVTSTHADRFLSWAETDIHALSPYFLKLVNYPNLSRLLKQYVGNYFFPLEEKQEHWVHYLKLLLQSDLRESYSRLTIPTVHILGTEDVVIQVEVAELQKLNNTVQHSLVTGAGHAVFVTHPEACETCFQ